MMEFTPFELCVSERKKKVIFKPQCVVNWKDGAIKQFR